MVKDKKHHICVGRQRHRSKIKPMYEIIDVDNHGLPIEKKPKAPGSDLVFNDIEIIDNKNKPPRPLTDSDFEKVLKNYRELSDGGLRAKIATELSEVTEKQINKSGDKDEDMPETTIADIDAVLRYSTSEEFAKTGKYPIDIQKLAVLYSEILTHQDGKYLGKTNFAAVSRVMGIPETTIRDWVNNKEEIKSLSSSLGRVMDEYVTLKLDLLMLNLLESFKSRRFEEMADKDFVGMFNVLYNKWRLQRGMSTSNIATHHMIGLLPPKHED